MENEKVGRLIRRLREGQQLTQKALAEKMHISDKTVSKWERGFGCPEISLCNELSKIFCVDLEKLLTGELIANEPVGGNMKNTLYYICPSCKNISLCTGNAEISCCGKKLAPWQPRKAGTEEKLAVEIIEDEWYITSTHPMTKADYISFAAFVTGDRLELIKRYPEWDFSCRIPKKGHGKLVWYSTSQGLLYQLL